MASVILRAECGPCVNFRSSIACTVSYRVGRGTKNGVISSTADHNFLPSSLPHWLLEFFQSQQQAPMANCSKIASLHFRVLLAFALVAGRWILLGIIITLSWLCSLESWPLSLALVPKGWKSLSIYPLEDSPCLPGSQPSCTQTARFLYSPWSRSCSGSPPCSSSLEGCCLPARATHCSAPSSLASLWTLSSYWGRNIYFLQYLFHQKADSTEGRTEMSSLTKDTSHHWNNEWMSDWFLRKLSFILLPNQHMTLRTRTLSTCQFCTWDY